MIQLDDVTESHGFLMDCHKPHVMMAALWKNKDKVVGKEILDNIEQVDPTQWLTYIVEVCDRTDYYPTRYYLPS